jgi:hypothetical protein
MANLYELTGNAERLTAALTGELTDEEWVALRQEYEDNAEAITDKLDGYAKAIRNLTAESVSYQTEEARLAGLRLTVDRNIARMREAVELAMRACGETKVKTTIGTWAFQKNPPSVNVLNAAKIPADYMKQPDPVIDRAAILAKLKAGEAVEGAELKQGDSLRFR